MYQGAGPEVKKITEMVNKVADGNKTIIIARTMILAIFFACRDMVGISRGLKALQKEAEGLQKGPMAPKQPSPDTRIDSTM